MRLFQRAAASLLALAVVGLPVAAAGPALASTVGGSAAAVVPCLTEHGRQRCRADDTAVPKWRQHSDTTSVTAADLARAARRARPGTAYVNREVRPRLAARVNIPVYVHVIKGKHRGERNPASRSRVRELIAILNRGMAGGQSHLSTPLRYRFILKKIDYTKNDGWYHAYLFGPRDQQAKRELHRGNARTLNLYINGGGPRGNPVLGWARFPWQYAGTPKLDGVSVNVAGPARRQCARLQPRRHRDPRDRPLARALPHLPGRLQRPGRPRRRHPGGGRAQLRVRATRDTCAADPGSTRSATSWTTRSTAA